MFHTISAPGLPNAHGAVGCVTGDVATPIGAAVRAGASKLTAITDTAANTGIELAAISDTAAITGTAELAVDRRRPRPLNAPRMGVAAGARGCRKHRGHRTQVPTAAGDAGTTSAVVGRTVLASVEGELAALVACGDRGARGIQSAGARSASPPIAGPSSTRRASLWTIAPVGWRTLALTGAERAQRYAMPATLRRRSGDTG